MKETVTSAVTARVYTATRSSVPFEPITRMGYVPTGVLPVVVMARVAEHVGLQDGGVNPQETPAGRSSHRKVRGCAEPESSVAVAVVETPPPGFVVPDEGFTAMEKLNGGGPDGGRWGRGRCGGPGG